MAERFERLFSLPNDLYTSGAPVILSTGVLLKDTQTGNVIVQLKFRSVSPIVLKALCVDISAYDISGNKIEGVKNYQYLDLSVKNGYSFGNTKAIILPDKTARSFSIGKLSVVLADSTTIDVSLPLLELPKLETLFSALGNNELVKQYKISTSDKSKYVPCGELDIWACSCGRWNQGEHCTNCGLIRSQIFESYSIDILSANMENRLVQEQLHREENKRVQKKRIQQIKVVSAVAIFVAIFAALFRYWLYPNLILPAQMYRSAETLLEDGEYAEAVKAFNDLDDFWDSEDRATDASTRLLDEKYEHGIQLMNGGKYQEAIKLFKSIENHKDSVDKITEIHICILDSMYNDADLLLSKDKYKEAIEAFTEIVNYKEAPGIYKDSLEKIETAKSGLYGKAEELLLSDKNADAAMIFGSLGDYNDAKSRSFELWNDIVGKSRKTFDTGSSHTVAVKTNGQVLATGDNEYGQCDVSSWENIISVVANSDYTIGLKADGTVVSTGENKHGECNVSSWKNIVAIATGGLHTVGLKSDGTVVTTDEDDMKEISSWNNIIAIASGSPHTVGLKSNGTLITTGSSLYNECDVEYWRNIKEISASDTNTIGIDKNGTVWITGEAGIGYYDKEIIAVYPEWRHTIYLLDNGHVEASDRGSWGECNVGLWDNIVSISTDMMHTVGLRSDGTLIATGNNIYGQCDVSEWRDIRLPYE